MSEPSPLLTAQQKFIDAIHATAIGTENITLADALGRILAQPLQAQEDAPAYHRAIVEGFIVHASATQGASDENPISFKIIGNVRPGDALCPHFASGEAIEVSTGAIVIDGPIAIVRMWEAKRNGDSFTISRPFPPRFFIEDQGCDIKKGDEIITAGTPLQPQHIGTLASLGINSIEVNRPPQVTLFASGDEVIPHTETFRPGLIRDCNTPMLSAAVISSGGIPQTAGIMGDNFDTFVSAVKASLKTTDMIIIAGGTAIGGRDFISDLIREVGELVIDGVPMKSGRPLIMGLSNGKPIICVAGHPPEALRGFRLFGGPAIAKLTGQHVDLPAE